MAENNTGMDTYLSCSLVGRHSHPLYGSKALLAKQETLNLKNRVRFPVGPLHWHVAQWQSLQMVNVRDVNHYE